MLRKATIDDFDGMYKLWSTSAGIGIVPGDDTREGIGRFLLRNPNTCFVYENDGVIVGTVLGGHDGRRGHIYHCAVAEDCRRKGIGRELTDAVLEALKNEGIRKVLLVAMTENTGGNEFWGAMGFTTRPDLTYRNISLIRENTDTGVKQQ